MGAERDCGAPRSASGSGTDAATLSLIQESLGTRSMQPTDVNQLGSGTSENPGGESASGQEPRILASVKAVAQRITERVQKALGDTDAHTALPTEDHEPLA